MKNLHKPLFATTVMIASLAVTTLAFAHGTSRHGSMAGQSMSGQGHMMTQDQMGQQANMAPAKMQYRQDHRLKNRSMGSHQRLENYDVTANDPDLKRAFADE